jgi:predicted transcriptional regulator
LIGTLEAFKNDIEYRGNHYLCFIPPLFKRMHKLGSCSVITPGLSEIHEVGREFYRSTIKSKLNKIATLFFIVSAVLLQDTM